MIAKNLLTKESYYVNHRDDNLGIPYGMFYDPGNQRLLVSYLGTLDKKSTGGFVVFEVKKSDVLNVTHAKYELPKKCDWMILCELKYVFQKFNHAWGWLAMRLGS